MALLYAAQVAPSKPELLGAWVPTQRWSGGATPDAVIAAYRFDDPAGEVGIETHLVRVGDRVLQVPLTYRAAPLAGGAPGLVTTMEHSVLGRRWIYDACVDPVYAAVLARAIVTGDGQSEEWVVADPDTETETDARQREPAMRVGGHGVPGLRLPTVPGPDAPATTPVSTRDDVTATTIRAGGLTVAMRRRLGAPASLGTLATLDGTWPGRAVPGVLAELHR